MSKKNFNDTIENRSRDLPICSAVLQPLRHRVPRFEYRAGLIVRKDGCDRVRTIPIICKDNFVKYVLDMKPVLLYLQGQYVTYPVLLYIKHSFLIRFRYTDGLIPRKIHVAMLEICEK
jgi:hypothetical protein